ncbi:MAG: hypothetical protein A2020_15300 [Lentisphaerae bacterium GWF2_45_14]|nr:MAG: hypothetical protein A2020_15300 [Lentisphaerae bacterium GWF2_45_14]
MIKKLFMRDFRNFSEVSLSFSDKLNVLTGENGQGKTNLLEAIFFTGMLRSFRTSRVADMKKIGSQSFYISCEADSDGKWTKKLEIEYGELRKLKIDSSIVKKASEFIRNLMTVAFSPDDIAIVNGNSRIRRRFIDICISMESPSYMSALLEYSEALLSRNRLLRSVSPDIKILRAFEPVMAEKASVISKYRLDYSELLKKEMQKILCDYMRDETDFDIRYRNSSGTFSKDEYMNKFEKERNKDILRKMTSFGPQTDEFDFFLNSKLLRCFGSTGQCRFISLCLKMAELNLLLKTEENIKKAVVLVDDVTGELDSRARDYFFKVINRAGQTFFTFTSVPTDKYFKEASIYKINSGRVASLYV